MLQHTEAVDKIPEYDKRKREHYWIATVAYHIADPAEAMRPDNGPVMMDLENLVHVGPIGCFHCEEPWDRYLHFRKCPGDPNRKGK